MKISRGRGRPSFEFPPIWLPFVDELLPNWVKKAYSPKEKWKDKPFSKEDAHFFFRGIDELSSLFTEERPKGMPPYFNHPKYRSAYLLYFLPLQAAKFLTLFQTYPHALQATLDQGRKTGVLRVADLGAGPATASLALLMALTQLPLKKEEELPKIELNLFDTNASILADGEAIVDLLASQMPRLKDRVRVRVFHQPWWKAPHLIEGELSLVLMGHVLNESPGSSREADGFWQSLLEKSSGGGVLMVEPAARRPAQLLSRVRDELFETELVERTPTRLWGPCLHADQCPLAQGRDWCFVSIPVHVPGKWFKSFSEGLGSERQWLKYAHLWLASRDYPSDAIGLKDSQLRRVISDPLNQGPRPVVLICEPEKAGRFAVKGSAKVYRGDLIQKFSI